MKFISDLIIQFWYLWVLIILLGILKTFQSTIKGYFGEKSVRFFLSRLDKKKYKVINDLLIKIGDKTTQIDHIVISNYGIFVIETKNYKGWIIGNEYDEYWQQIIYKRKEKLFNPIKQNYLHISALKELLNEYEPINFISIITFTTKAELKVNVTTDVVYTVKLLPTIKKYKKETILDTTKEEIYQKILSLNIKDKNKRKEHIKQVKTNTYMKNKLIDSNICPKCGGKLVLRNGKYGQFKGCSNYPKCKFIVK